MAKAGSKPSLLGKVLVWIILIVVVAVAAAIWLNRPVIDGYANVGTAYAARVACSCRFVAGRDLDDCSKDKVAGMELISLSDDVEAQSVTASFPLVTATTATYREGYGCVLEEWQG